MQKCRIYLLAVITFMVSACGSVERLAKHDFNSGYYKLKVRDSLAKKVYVNLNGDSLDLYNIDELAPVKKTVDTSQFRSALITAIKPDDYLYGSRFTRNVIDIDLTTALLKYRPAQKDVPNQLNANLNAAVYAGLRKDFFKVSTAISPLHQVHSSLRHFEIDAGLFAGLGITPVNYTVTSNKVELEYDGIVFEKGFAVYFGLDFLTVGISLGFDNLLDPNRKSWIYNQKPWIGLMLGIANF